MVQSCGLSDQGAAGVSFFLKTGAVDAPTPEAFEKGAAKGAVYRIVPR
jgi:hypothetical protein